MSRCSDCTSLHLTHSPWSSALDKGARLRFAAGLSSSLRATPHDEHLGDSVIAKYASNRSLSSEGDAAFRAIAVPAGFSEFFTQMRNGSPTVA